MASNVTMTVYLGAGEEGMRNDKLISEEAVKRGMKKSEFVLTTVLDYIKHSRQRKSA